ncbi:unnamed protein product [Trichogramma brassicae]|uniref:Reverse transcriptase domain-containing protein n=1 Tax=Trichogramma brassicae TaxID=86971 RepID=A0A6H5II42_9HYME|nr:unnamed protein product [Trichogramma brassicae]
MSLEEIGHADLVQMDIKELPGSKPVSRKPYPASNAERERIKKIVNEWKQLGIVTDTDSAYASPVLIFKKNNGEDRLVVDYRKLNLQTEKMSFPLPNIEDHLNQLRSENKLFIVLDLAHGYLQVPLSKEARQKTAFVTPDDTGEFTRMSFGLSNAPFYFSKLMKKVLEPVRNNVVLHYLDDILIAASTWQILLQRLKLVLDCLRKARLTIKLQKCSFFLDKVTYLGLEISSKGVSPGKFKLAAIEKYPVPKTVHQLRRFLGLVSFFRRFVPKFVWIAQPLNNLH